MKTLKFLGIVALCFFLVASLIILSSIGFISKEVAMPAVSAIISITVIAYIVSSVMRTINAAKEVKENFKNIKSKEAIDK